MNLAWMARMVAEVFVAGLWQGIVLMLLVAGFLRVVPRLGAGGRFAVWGLAFVAAGAVPFLRLSGGGAVVGTGVRLGLGWGFAVAGCWGLLMIVRIGRLIGQGMQLRRIWRDAEPFAVGEGIAALLREMPRRPVLCVSGAMDAPSVIGFWSPKLLIPEWQIGSLSEGEMRQIVLHECEHLRRGDDWMNLAQKVGLALFPLNPALLWADRRLSLERELACDAGVVGRTGAALDYASCLTRLAEQRLGRRRLGLALSAWGRRSELGQRVHRLLRPVGSMGRGWRRVSVGVLGLVVVGGSFELARVPRLVSFADAGPVSVEAAATVERVPAGGRMMPVVYTEPLRMEHVVAKARGPAGKRSQHRVAGRQTGSVRQREVAAGMRAAFRPAKAGYVLTSFDGDTGRAVSPAEPVGFRVVDAVSLEGSKSYAAVQVANGWLIFQL